MDIWRIPVLFLFSFGEEEEEEEKEERPKKTFPDTRREKEKEEEEGVGFWLLGPTLAFARKKEVKFPRKLFSLQKGKVSF